jgi:hypothetical protein
VVAILLLIALPNPPEQILSKKCNRRLPAAVVPVARVKKAKDSEREDKEMMHMAMALLNDSDLPGGFGMWMFLSVGAVALFAVFIPIVVWIESRRKEREAYYRSETLRRVSEASSEGSKATLEVLWEENRQKQVQIREGLKIGGLINMSLGIALMAFLKVLIRDTPVYLCGLILLMIGIAMLVYVYVLAAPIVDKRSQ